MVARRRRSSGFLAVFMVYFSAQSTSLSSDVCCGAFAFVGVFRDGSTRTLTNGVSTRKKQHNTFFATTGEDLLDTSLKEEPTSQQQDAIDALNKLRDRQRQDLEETERMLSLLGDNRHQSDTNSNKDNDDYEDVIKNKESSAETLSTAASILSGFDYGFQSRSEGAPTTLKGGLDALLANQYGGPPANIWKLGTQQFVRNLKAMQGEYADEPDIELTKQQILLQEKLQQLTLNSTEIWEREFADGPIQAPWVIKLPYLAVCFMLDVLYEKRNVPARFFLLETVARMPYMSYIAMLHLYETVGFWRRSAEMKRVHFAEELNEYRHLLIMESLGGDQQWLDRFMAQHAAVLYYFILNILWAVSPSLSYRFSELLETHAVNTYSIFLENNKELLEQLPPPNAAIDYYSLGSSDPFYAEFQTAALASGKEIRRPGQNMLSLYDVFSAIRDDEGDHVSTMHACLDPEANVRSPSIERKILLGVAVLAAASATGVFDTGLMDSGGLVDSADVVSDAAATIDAGTIAEAVAAGMAGLAGLAQKVSSGEDGLGATGTADLIEAGSDTALTFAQTLQRAAEQIVEFLARML